MPTVPIEQNKIGLADVTDAKLKAGDFSGSGLSAIGAGMQVLGDAGQTAASNFKDARDLAEKHRQADLIRAAMRAGQTPDPAAKPAQQSQQGADAPRPAPDPQGLFNDAALKAGWNQYGEETTPILYTGKSAYFATSGFAAANAQKEVIDQVTAIHDRIRNGLPPDLQAMFDQSAGSRFALDLANINAHPLQQFGVEQERQTSAVIESSVNDAINHRSDPAIADKFLATGAENLVAQGVRNNLGIDRIRSNVSDYYSNAYRRAIYEDAQGDPLGAVARFRTYGAAMNGQDRHAVQEMLFAPLAELQGVADADGLFPASSTSAPTTPATRGPADLDARMRAISPSNGAAAEGQGAEGQGSAATAAPSGGLPALVRRYGGDAAKAWAASRIGADALDAAIAGKGDAWLGAIPDDARAYVVHNMALLNAAGSHRLAPAPEDREAAAQAIDAQDWNDERKQIAHAELNRRIGLADQRSAAKATAATNSALELAGNLGPGFISTNQIPPAMRDDLPPEALAALARRAWQNSNPTPVAPHGQTAHDLNQLAAEHPDQFVKQDLRLARDLVTPDEYASLGRLQEGLKGYPPSAGAITQQRFWGMAANLAGNGLSIRNGVSLGGDRTLDPDTAQGKLDDPTNGEQELRDIFNSAALERQKAEYFSADGHGPAEGDGTGEPKLQPAVYSRFADGPEATAGTGGRFQTIAAQDGSTAGPTGKGSRPPVDPTLPTGTPSNHQPGMYRHATTGKRMAGNQLVRQQDVQAENNRQLRSDLKNPFILAFLDLLSWTEGTTKYMWKTRHLSSPPLTDLGSFPYSFKQPVGRYQIEPNTYDEIAVARLGLKDFSPESQDMTAAMQLRMLHASDALLKGDLAGAIRAASSPWASVPVSAQENHSALRVIQNGAPKVNPKTGKFVFQVAKDYPDVVSKYKFFLKCYGVPDSQINALKY